jgi:hypothetical protein
MSSQHPSPPRRHSTKGRRRPDVSVLKEQLPLFDIFEKDGEEVMEPMCGGCGRCAYTPLAGRRRVHTQKP